LAFSLFGKSILANIIFIKVSTPYASAFTAGYPSLLSSLLSSLAFGAAATGTTGKYGPNFVCLNLALNFFIYLGYSSSSTPPGNKSTLLKAIISLSIIISPKTIHSAVYV